MERPLQRRGRGPRSVTGLFRASFRTSCGRISSQRGRFRLVSIAANLKRKLRLPVIGSPLFIISTPDLVIAQCKAGIVGSFPTLNARPALVLEEGLKRIISELKEHDARYPQPPAAPFAVNQIVHPPHYPPPPP